MSKLKKKVFTVCVNIVALTAVMCIGAVCHAVWQGRTLSRNAAESNGIIEQRHSSNHLVRVSIPWGRSEFDFPDDDASEQQQIDEEFMESLLTACGFEYRPSYEMHESRCYVVKGFESWVLVNRGIVLCKGWPRGIVPESRFQMAKETVAKLNADAPRTIRYCIDGDLLWCESSLPVEVLRRMVSLDEQRETLRLLSAIPNEAIKKHESEFDKILSQGE